MASFAKFGNDLYTGRRQYDIVGRRAWWYAISALVILVSIVVPIVRGGFTFGIEFTGGTEFQVTGVSGEIDTTRAANIVGEYTDVEPRVQKAGGDSLIVQTDALDDADQAAVHDRLVAEYHVSSDDVSTRTVGPSWGSDITQQALRGLIVFVALAALVMGLYFRTWKMSLAAVVALIHDLVIVAGFYGITGTEITPAAVIGFLTILGYSLYDTVVVFDKIRENTQPRLMLGRRTFRQSVNLAVNQTLVRSINTSVVALLPVAGILFIGAFILGAGTLKDISLALFVGILVGTYSTIFIAAPLYSQLREGEKGLHEIDAQAPTHGNTVSSPEQAADAELIERMSAEDALDRRRKSAKQKQSDGAVV